MRVEHTANSFKIFLAVIIIIIIKWPKNNLNANKYVKMVSHYLYHRMLH